tara:strand:- start:217 stop:1068 length:852 start_codon:yes stop_codon:yes gene_type:complete
MIMIAREDYTDLYPRLAQDIELRKNNRNLSMGEYIVLKMKDLEVLEASPVRRVRGRIRKQPEVDLQCGVYGLQILSKSVLFHFLKTVDPELTYNDFHLFIDYFDLKTMIQDFVDSQPDMSIPVWVSGDEISAIDDGGWQSNSEYLFTIYEEMYDFYYPDSVYLKSIDMGTKRRPAICIERDDRIVEIVCDQQKTRISLRIKIGDGFVQPCDQIVYRAWIHLIESDALYKDIDNLLEMSVQTKAQAQAKIGGTEVLSPSRGRANAIPFYPRNKIEREDYFQLSQ